MRRINGFTLIELIVTLAVMAIVAAIAIPGFSGMIRANRTAAQVNDLVSSLSSARSEAVKRGLPVAICASANPNDGAPDCSGATNWATGWITFVDANGDWSKDAGEELLRVWQALDGASTLSGQDALLVFRASGALDYETLQSATGRLDSEFTFRPKGCEDNEERLISVETMGHVSTQRQSC